MCFFSSVDVDDHRTTGLKQKKEKKKKATHQTCMCVVEGVFNALLGSACGQRKGKSAVRC